MTPRLLVSTILVCCLASSVASAAVFDGKVKDVGKRNVVLAVGVESMTFEINNATMITVNGKEARLEDLVTGQTAKINATKVDDGWIAKSVAARLAPLAPPGAADPGRKSGTTR
ncbi:MAG: hypothetical protein RIC55_05400 [Pirellulaceae bacterium]